MKILGTKNELISELLKLDNEKIYSMEIKEPKSKRTLQQNKYMWALIREIAKKQYQDEMEIYISALEEANAKYTYIMGLEDIQDELKKNFTGEDVISTANFFFYNCNFRLSSCFS